jgi:hypothetical protein
MDVQIFEDVLKKNEDVLKKNEDAFSRFEDGRPPKDQMPFALFTLVVFMWRDKQ